MARKRSRTSRRSKRVNRSERRNRVGRRARGLERSKRSKRSKRKSRSGRIIRRTGRKNTMKVVMRGGMRPYNITKIQAGNEGVAASIREMINNDNYTPKEPGGVKFYDHEGKEQPGGTISEFHIQSKFIFKIGGSQYYLAKRFVPWKATAMTKAEQMQWRRDNLKGLLGYVKIDDVEVKGS